MSKERCYRVVRTQRERGTMSKVIPGFWPEKSLCQEAQKNEVRDWRIISWVLIMLHFQSLRTFSVDSGMMQRLLVKGQD